MKLNEKWLYDNNLVNIISAIEKYGGNIRFVGGCVRDSLLNREICDIDIVTDLLPNDVVFALTNVGIKVIPTGITYGTVTAVTKLKSFEITTLRSDISCYGRRADVEFTNDWKIDASRRDFTFNAIYCDKNGVLYDYFSGIEDLMQKKLRFIGKSEKRIQEDYLRILRAFRFSAQICEGNISNDILKSCTDYAHKISYLSKERIRDEFFKIISSNHSFASLRRIEMCGIMKYIIPYKMSYDILSLQELRDLNPLIKLAAILRTINNYNNDLSNEVRNIFNLSNKQTKTLSLILKKDFPSFPWSALYQRKSIILFGKDLYCDVVRILDAESNSNVANEYLAFAKSFEIPKFPITGLDLIKIGCERGRKMGEIVEKLKVHWEESLYSLTKDELLHYSKKIVMNK